MSEQSLREQLIEQARRMNASGLNQGTSGNLSVRFGDGLLITPSGIPYRDLSPGDLVPLAMDGSRDHALTPSSEWRFHRDIYAARPDVNAVVHAHPTYCTSLAIQGMEIPPIHYMIAVSGGPSVRCARYETFGTAELSEAALEALADRTACLLAHHGMIATGPSLEKAMWVAEEVETLARQYVIVLQIGEPRLLPEDEIERVVEKFAAYGPRPGTGETE